MKKAIIYFSLLIFIAFTSSCSKDDPTQEHDAEEVSQASLIFTEVESDQQGGYRDVKDGQKETVTFSGSQYLPPAGLHLHLFEGKTYRLDLIAKDFAGRETQHTFLNRADIHQAFILGAPDKVLAYQYADKSSDGKDLQVGVKGYLHVEAASSTFVFRYIMRHLNPGVKSKIKASNWNNENYTQFTGANDLDLKVEIHPVAADHGHGHDDEHDHGHDH